MTDEDLEVFICRTMSAHRLPEEERLAARQIIKFVRLYDPVVAKQTSTLQRIADAWGKSLDDDQELERFLGSLP